MLPSEALRRASPLQGRKPDTEHYANGATLTKLATTFQYSKRIATKHHVCKLQHLPDWQQYKDSVMITSGAKSLIE
jgi:hypothetical protein